ncbi:TRAP transporter substrate-binding protein [Pseudoroseicyclus aestuarii]|uniref:TRAP-type mannitol/chloroaromatic compound transport system substrate-binding protein n=1 Tax=Pseudoroseicyclus aestuarii TaxID=1795041 RepID=A0A318SZZ1_9RHOB|nr:TRAP transporter substrate-binding protein [Pseudoroseicyclus aestuarii]PYE85377.1 TRAP-type mannitol/chloroaromatic compound transport system substrate-binding protein [Pseudoroseicyclus aestuarii]
MINKLIGTTALALALASGAAAQDSIEMRFQSSDNSGTAAFEIQQDWAAHVGEMSDGRISIEMLPVGSIVEYNETLDAVGAGILDGHITDSSYFTGKDAAFALIGNPVGAYSSPAELRGFFDEGGGTELYNEILAPYGVHFIGPAAQPAEAIPSTVPIDSVADLQGVKMRAPEGMVQSVFASAGAAPVNLPQSEVFTSLDKGVISAADATTLATNHSMGLHDVAMHPIWPGFHSLPLNEVSMNAAEWDALSEEDQQLLTDSVAWYADTLAERIGQRDEEVAEELRATEGVTIHTWSEEAKREFRQIAQEQWAPFAERSDNAQRVYDSLTAYLSEQGLL